MRQRRLLQPQGQQGSILELAEAPLIGVRNKCNPLGADDLESPTVRRQAEVYLGMGDQIAGLDERIVEPRRDQMFVVLACNRVDLPVEHTALREHVPCRVAKRCAMGLCGARLELRCRITERALLTDLDSGRVASPYHPVICTQELNTFPEGVRNCSSSPTTGKLCKSQAIQVNAVKSFCCPLATALQLRCDGSV